MKLRILIKFSVLNNRKVRLIRLIEQKKKMKKCDIVDMYWLLFIVTLDNTVIALDMKSCKYEIISFLMSDLVKKIDTQTELLLLK